MTFLLSEGTTLVSSKQYSI